MPEISRFLEVKNANYLKDYQLFIEFNDGTSMVVDLERSLEGKIYEPLRDLFYFKQFDIKFNTIEWPNGADFAPEYLFEIGKVVILES